MNNTTTAEKMEIAPLVQIREKAQITLPSKIRKILGIKKGDYLEAKVKNNGIFLSPKTILDKLPIVTLSKKGEEMLKEALDDVKKGRIRKFKNIEELVNDLHK